MSVLCANPQCKMYRKEVDLDTNRDFLTSVYQGMQCTDKIRLSGTKCCGGNKWWRDYENMCCALTDVLEDRIADSILTLEQIEAIERILKPEWKPLSASLLCAKCGIYPPLPRENVCLHCTQPPSLEDESCDLAGIGARQ